MPRQVIVIMDEHYPFGEYEESTSADTKVLVRKIYPLTPESSSKIMQKITILRRIKSQNLIKIESLLQQEDSVHFLYEYVPIKLETWISNINDQFIKNFRDQLIKLSVIMASNGLQTKFELGKIGMDQNYNAKYFLDLGFDIVDASGREKLKNIYQKDITNLFKPYIAISGYNPPNSERSGNDSSRKQRGEVAISPPTNKQKQQALEKYYQEANMSVDSENEKILQEFMDVLDGEEEGEEEEARITAQSSPAQFKKPNNKVTAKVQPQNQSMTMSKGKIISYEQQESKLKSQKLSQPIKAQMMRPEKQGSIHSQQKNQFSSNQRPQTQHHIEQQSSQFPKNSKKFTSMNNIKNIESVQGSQIYPPPQASQAWSLPSNLQKRVKMVIQKGLQAIKRFKSATLSFK